MDLAGLTANELVFRYDPTAMGVTDVMLGTAIRVNPASPPAITVDSANGIIRIRQTDDTPLYFNGGGDVLAIRVHGGGSGETSLVMNNPDFRDSSGAQVIAAVAGGRARVE